MTEEIIEAEFIEPDDDANPGSALTPVPQSEFALQPAFALREAEERHKQLVEFVRGLMVDGLDYGTIPGTAKPTLYKPGAEKLTTFFGLTVTYDLEDEIKDFDSGVFYFRYKCSLFRGDLLIADSEGSANSKEGRYAWRWVKYDALTPAQRDNVGEFLTRESTAIEFDFAINKAETTGQWGKPQEYWDAWSAAIESGEARRTTRKTGKGKELDAWEMGDVSYRVPNDDIFTLVNTLQKMAQKRAFVAATLNAVNASEFFTQDIEDMDGFSEPADHKPAPQAAKKSTPAKKKKGVAITPRESEEDINDFIRNLMSVYDSGDLLSDQQLGQLAYKMGADSTLAGMKQKTTDLGEILVALNDMWLQYKEAQQ